MSDMMKGFKKVGSTDTHTTFQHPDGHILHVSNQSLDGSKRNEMRAIPEKKMADGGMSVGDQVADAQQGNLPQIPDPGTPEPTDLSNAGTPVEPKDGPAPLAPQRVEGGQPDPMADLPGYTEQKNSLDMQAANAQDVGAASAKLYHNQAANEQAHGALVRKTMEGMQKDVDNISQDIKNSHIDANHYMESISAGKKVTTALGLLLGGMGASANGGKNPAMEFLNNQIDRDLAVQKANMGKKENLLSALQKQYNNRLAAEDMFRVIRANTMANQLGELAAKSQSANAQPAKLAALSQLHQTYMPFQQRAAALKVAGDMAQQQQAPNEAIAARLSGFLVPEKEQAEASKELNVANKVKDAHEQADRIVDQVTQLQTAGNRLGNPIQSKQQIDALNAQLIPLILATSPSKRLTSETLKEQVKPFEIGITTGRLTGEKLRQGLHNLIDTSADATPTLDRFQVPVPKYGGNQKEKASAMDKLGNMYKFDKSTGGMRRVKK